MKILTKYILPVGVCCCLGVITACQKHPLPEQVLSDISIPAAPQEPSVAGEDVVLEKENGEEQDKGIEEPIPVKPVDFFESSETAEPVDSPYTHADLEYFDRRLKGYEAKLSRWQNLQDTISLLDMKVEKLPEWQFCLQKLQGITAEYGTMIHDPSGKDESQDDTWRADIAFLESDCENVFNLNAAVVSEKLQHYKALSASQVGKIIRHYADQNEYQRIITTYQNMTLNSGLDLDSAAKGIYGNALRQAGRLDEAADVFLDLLDTGEDSQSWIIRLQVAEILMATGNIERARTEYQKVTDFFDSWRTQEAVVQARLHMLEEPYYEEKALHLYSEALYAWLTGDGIEIPGTLKKNIKILETKYSGTIYADEGQRLMKEAEQNVQDFVIRELDKVIKFATENKFNKARDLLDSLTKLKIHEEARSIIKVVADDVERAEAEEKMLQEELRKQAIDEQWQQAVLFYDQKKYDRAIELFRQLVNTGYRQKAIKKMNEAVEIAAAEMRKQAALLFSRSRRIKDRDQQLALLYESQAILQEIIQRYPEAEVINKVSVNLEVIEKQILELNPPQPGRTGSDEDKVMENEGEKHLKNTSESVQDIKRE